jgi:hypothetical protein
MGPDFYYFATAFLDTTGFFGRTKRLWTAEPFPAAEAVTTGIICELEQFSLNLTVVNDTRELLGAGRRAFTNAVL